MKLSLWLHLGHVVCNEGSPVSSLHVKLSESQSFHQLWKMRAASKVLNPSCEIMERTAGLFFISHLLASLDCILCICHHAFCLSVQSYPGLCLVELAIISIKLKRLTFFMWCFWVAVAWNGWADDLKDHIWISFSEQGNDLVKLVEGTRPAVNHHKRENCLSSLLDRPHMDEMHIYS